MKFNKLLQPKVTFRNLILWYNLYGETSHPPCKGNHFVPIKYSNFHNKMNFRKVSRNTSFKFR